MIIVVLSVALCVGVDGFDMELNTKIPAEFIPLGFIYFIQIQIPLTQTQRAAGSIIIITIEGVTRIVTIFTIIRKL